MSDTRDKIWFAYRRSPGQLRGRPASVTGGIMFVVAIVATVLLSLLLARLGSMVGPALMIGGIIAGLAIGLSTIFWMVVAKGRPA